MQLLFAVMVILSAAHAIDLAALRQSAGMPTISQTPSLMIPNLYSEPLSPASFLPLCGDGIINTVADYQNYYSKNNLPQGSLRLSVNEACDDGNRLDGDGCSSDCVWQDAIAPPCQVPVHGVQIIENIDITAYVPRTSRIIACTPDAIYALDPSTIGMQATLLITKTFTVRAILAENTTHVWIFANSDPSVYLLQIANTSTLLRWMSLPMQPTASCGIFYRQRGSSRLYFATSDSAKAINVDIWARNMTGSIQFNTTELPAQACIAPGGYPMLNMFEHYWGFDGYWSQTPSLDIRQTSNDAPNIWTQLLFITARYYVLLCSYDFPLELNTEWVLEGTLMQSQSLANMILPGALFFSGYNARLVISPPSSLAMPLFMGFTAMVQSGMTNSAFCNSTNICALDLPLEYDMLSMNPYPNGIKNSQSQTLFDIMRLAFAEITMSDGILVQEGLRGGPMNRAASVNMERILRSMVPLIKMPQQVWGDPRTHNMWALRGGKLYETSHAGFRPTLPNSDTQCLPAMSRICPPGTWSAFNQGGNCTSCAVVPTLRDPIEQQIAFASQCSPGVGQRRRLLSTTKNNVYVRFVMLVPPASLSAFKVTWPTAQCGPTVCDVVVLSDDPLITIRKMREWTLARVQQSQQGWEILTQPFVYSHFDTTQPSASATPDIGLIVGCALGGTALVIVIIAVVYVTLNKKAAKNKFKI